MCSLPPTFPTSWSTLLYYPSRPFQLPSSPFHTISHARPTAVILLGLDACHLGLVNYILRGQSDETRARIQGRLWGGAPLPLSPFFVRNVATQCSTSPHTGAVIRFTHPTTQTPFDATTELPAISIPSSTFPSEEEEQERHFVSRT